jgi:diketogulonate reductase-like aldo/keto reductase
MHFGAHAQARGDDMFRLYARYREAGGNFFDTAHSYACWMPDGDGASERGLGECLRKFGDRAQQVIPKDVFINQTTPDETLCAGFNTGYYSVAGGYRSSLILAAYHSGKGRFIPNTMRLLENLDKNPAADRLLLNLIRHFVK